MVLDSVSLDTLLALIRGVSLFSMGMDERRPRRSAVSADRRGEEAELRVTVHSESLRAEMEPRRLLLGCASMSSREGPFRPDGGLEVELVVDTSDATDTRSASARSVSEVSPRRARRRREALVGRGWGKEACFPRDEAVAVWRLRLVLEEEPLAELLEDLPSSLEWRRSSVEVSEPRLCTERPRARGPGPEYVSWSEDRMSEMGKEEVWSSSVRSSEGCRALEEEEDGCTERRASARVVT